MFLNKHNQLKFTRRNYKALKLIYKSNLLNNIFLEKNFILLFYYDFFSTKMLFDFQRILQEEALKSSFLKKNIFNSLIKDSKLDFIKNLTKNNTLIIFSNLNNMFDDKILTKLLTLKNLNFVGIFLDKKFLRPSELKILKNTTAEITQKKIGQVLQSKKLLITKTLSLKKTI